MKNLVRIAVLAGFLSGCAYNPNTGTYYFPTAYGQGYRYVAPYSYAPYPVAPYYHCFGSLEALFEEYQ